MSPEKILLKGATIINEDLAAKGHLLLNQGLIERIFRPDEYLSDSFIDGVKVYELDNCWIMPGVIDDQVHFREPGLEHKGDISTETVAAVSGGITSFMEMPNTIPKTTTQVELEKKFRIAAGKSLCNYSFYLGATNDNIDELKAIDRNNVCGIKVFMGSSTGNMLVDNIAVLKEIFRIKKVPIATHCEDESTVQANFSQVKNIYGEHIPVRLHPFIRSHYACEKSSRLAVSLAEQHETRLHLLHLSTAGEIRLLENTTPLSEKMITSEVCIHHLWFTDKDYEEKGALIKWNPAVKSETDRQALIRGLLDGYIDVVATDHAPHTLEEKKRPYPDSPSGGPMVQHALPAMLELYHQGNISLEKIVRVMCHNPAICFNIKNRGFIREGYAADLVVIGPDNGFKVTGENILYKCRWSPFEGQYFRSSVLYTFINGYPVFGNNKNNDRVMGQPLTFSR